VKLPCFFSLLIVLVASVFGLLPRGECVLCLRRVSTHDPSSRCRIGSSRSVKVTTLTVVDKSKVS
jgi:hypothetical protein